MLVLDHQFAINQGRFAGQLAATIDHPSMGPRQVIAGAGEGTDLAAINDDQDAAAVIFDLVNPSESYLSRNIVGFGRSEGLDGSRAAKTKVP